MSPKLLLERQLSLLGVHTLGPGSTRGSLLGLGFGPDLSSTLGFGCGNVTGSLVGHHITTSNNIICFITSITITGHCVSMYKPLPTLVATHSCLHSR